MNLLKKSILLCFALISLTSCFEDRDDNAILVSSVNDFVWKGMNIFYLYKDEIPDLADDRFSSNESYGNYLNSYTTPEALFESLIFDRQVTDRFSFITDDYIAFNQSLNGTNKSNGLRYYFFQDPQNASKVILVIRQVVPGSSGATANLTRGQFINQIDGTDLTEENLNTLLSPDTFTLHFANHNDNGTPETSDDSFTPNGTTVSLTKTVFTENPVHQSSIIDVNGTKIGYLLYNRFLGNFNQQLNTAFGTFKSGGVQELVIDLRYNPGGSVYTASLLGSMVTGQFTSQVFSKLVYNSTLQSENTNFEFVSNFDGNAINSLNLDKVYILTTASSASASELVINSLKEYVNVIQIGETTVGKTQASITIYDSPNFDDTNINPNHTYAMQPLVANSINVNDQAVPGTGLVPNIALTERALNLGTFGNVNEPLLAAAIANITGSGRYRPQDPSGAIPLNIPIDESKMQDMYIDSDHAPLMVRKQFFNQ
ncbi:C-terminal processing protease CtpA/Prc [Flavobacteriaceae bacterium MAR_2010_105]|nr:C-terminal processing protease CtpA/Prc [Flavobacteriaceae bacterium MAR_2010_105]